VQATGRERQRESESDRVKQRRQSVKNIRILSGRGTLYIYIHIYIYVYIYICICLCICIYKLAGSSRLHRYPPPNRSWFYPPPFQNQYVMQGIRGRRSVTEDASDLGADVSPVMRASPSICRVLTID